MIDAMQVGYPDGPMPSDTANAHAGPQPDPTAELAQFGQDNIPNGPNSVSESFPVSSLDLSTVAISLQESVPHHDAVALAEAYTNAINNAAMASGYCDMPPQGLDDAGPEPY